MYGLLVVCVIWDIRFLSYVFVTDLCDYYVSSSPLVLKKLYVLKAKKKKCKGHQLLIMRKPWLCTSIMMINEALVTKNLYRREKFNGATRLTR